MSSIRFGTDGWRAIIGLDFTYANLYRIATAFSRYAAKEANKKIIIGHDTRYEGESFARFVAQILIDNGLEPILSNKAVPTPVISFATIHYKAFAGLIITASHNPAEYNGFKIKNSKGVSEAPENIAKIEAILDTIPDPSPDEVKKIYIKSKKFNNLTDLMPDYKAYVYKVVNKDKIAGLQGSILYDFLYGAGLCIAGEVIKDGVKLNIDSIHNTVNPGFGGLHPEPIEANLTELKDRLKQGKYLCGFGTDGDADRLAMFDERGNYISPHKIMALLTYHLVKNKGLSGGLATTVSGSRLLINLAAKYNLKVFETPVGFKHIGGLFNTEDILIGGEESGGIAIKTAIPERDGLLNSLLILELIATENKPISQILSDIENENGKYYYRRLDLNIANLDTAKVKEKLGNFNVSIFDRPVVKTDRKDGIKFIFSPDMFLLIRSSGTEPLLRIYAESLSPTTTDKLIDSVKSYIESN